jgi:hypothetical protein
VRQNSDDANNIFYQSTIPGFSAFAIGVKEAALSPALPEEKPAEVPLPTGEVPAETLPEEEQLGVPITEVKKPFLNRTTMAWIVVAIIVVVAAIGYFMWQKNHQR